MKIYASLIGAVILTFLSAFISIDIKKYVAYAPELFGVQELTLVETPYQSVIGIIQGPDVAFVIIGTREVYTDAKLIQIAGDPIDNYGIRGPIPARMLVYSNGTKFRGWIYFRGHERKFCGGEITVPQNCMLKSQ